MAFARIFLASAALPAVLAVAACSATAPIDEAAIERAIAAHQYFEARDALLAQRSAQGESAQNSARLAQVMIALGDGLTAERYIDEIALRDGDSAEVTTLRAHALILQGRAYRAIEVLGTFAGTPPETGDHAWLRLWAAMEQGDNETARALAAKALAQYPGNAALHAKAARLAVQDGDWALAQSRAERALTIAPGTYEALLVMGESAIADGDLEAALATYQTAAQTYPEFAVPQANVAGLLLDLRRLDEAQAVLETAAGRHPDFALLRFSQARLAALQGRWEAARGIVQTLPVQWKRDFPASTLLEGEIEAALNNHEVARALLMTLADDPRFAGEIAALLARLPEA